MEIGQLLQENDSKNTLIILLGMSKAFGAVNRTLLCATLYKKCLPVHMFQQIAHGHQNTIRRCKEMGTYGTPVRNNIGIFRGEALSAILFIIYLDGVEKDYHSLGDKAGLPRRSAVQQTQENRNKIHSPPAKRNASRKTTPERQHKNKTTDP